MIIIKKNSYTVREIIFGLKDDFLARDEILNQMLKCFHPLEKNMNISLFYNDFESSIELEAAYNDERFISLLKYLFSKKYNYSASLYQDKDRLVFDEGFSDNQKIFPVEHIDSVKLAKLKELFDKLIQRTYDVTPDYKTIYSLYNTLYFVSDELERTFKIQELEYSPVYNLINISRNEETNQSRVLDILKYRFDKERFTKMAQYLIENRKINQKRVCVLENEKEFDTEFHYGIREKKDKVLLVRKIIK